MKSNYFSSLLLILLLLFNNIQGKSQDNTEHENTGYIYKENIKSVLISREDDSFSYPVIKLNTEQKIKLCFDDITSETKDYYYTIVHSDAQWNPSDLMPMEYIEGFEEGQIDDYNYSFNTSCEYVHYELIIPNEIMQPVISGNYIIKVYEDNDQSNLILTKRFSVVEQKLNIEAEVKRPSLPMYRDTMQEIDIIIAQSPNLVNNPARELNVVITQNNRWDNAIFNLKPKYSNTTGYVYNYEEENLFPGGYEYRHFNSRNVRYKEIETKNIYYSAPFYHIELQPDENTSNKLYSYREDFNGKQYIELESSDESYVEADYVFIHFNLSCYNPLKNANVYVFGEITNWEMSDKNKMAYNYEHEAYELTLFLKQGYCNYKYVVVENDNPKAENSYFEGNFYQTENDYVIYVYLQKFGANYDRLIGVKTINSMKRL